MNTIFRAALLALCMSALAQAADVSPSYISIWRPVEPGIAITFGTDVMRVGGSAEPLRDFTVGAQLAARNGPGVHQWAFGAATEAWAMQGSRSVLVGLESAVINLEPTNHYPKVANNAVMKNRADNDPDPGSPMNSNSIAYFVSAQPGTGFERGLVFDRDALLAPGARPAAIDLSDIPDDRIAEVDLIRIRKDVTLRYDPVTRQLVLHVEPPR